MSLYDDGRHDEYVNCIIRCCVMLLDMKKKESEIISLLNKYFGINSIIEISEFIDSAKKFISDRNKNYGG